MSKRPFLELPKGGPARRITATARFAFNRFFACLKAWLHMTRLSDAAPERALGLNLPVLSSNSAVSDQVSGNAFHEPTLTSLVPCDWAILSARDSANFAKIASLAPILVSMPPIEEGHHALSTAEIVENSAHIPWHQSSYTAYPASAYIISNAILNGAVGITGVGEYVISETLWHTDPDRHRYRREGAQITIAEYEVETLEGFHISLLTGAAESYWHSVIDAAARIALVPEDIINKAASVLLPSTGIAQKELIDLYGLPESVETKLVKPDESFRVANLIFPSSIHYLFDYHPEPLNAFYDRVISGVLRKKEACTQNSPDLIYIDRRSSGLRRLVNEEDLIKELEGLGFVAACLEHLTVSQQVILFRNAKVVVAPHGAGLTNIGFMRPNCWVIELMMDRYLNWCYRRIAAIRLLRYDCIIGQAVNNPDVVINTIHAQSWAIQVEEVTTFVTKCLSMSPPDQ